MTDYVLKCEPGFYNLSPDAFHRNAKHYLKCRMDFQSPTKGISSLPYFLLCRAMELELKACHLQTLRQKEVQDKFGHNLVAVYEALPATDQWLSISEFNLLSQASAIYENQTNRVKQIWSGLAIKHGFPVAPPEARSRCLDCPHFT